MTVVKRVTSHTAAVEIDDSCCAGLSEGELARRRAEIDRAIWSINRNCARRAAEAAGRADEGQEKGEA